MLPKMDGFTLLEKIKPLGIPVIFLTAKSSVADKVYGLRAGADDYITKPFEGIELLARIENVLRHYNKKPNIINFKDMEIHLEEMLVKKRGEAIGLTLKVDWGEMLGDPAITTAILDRFSTRAKYSI